MHEDTIVRSSASSRTIILASEEVKFIRIFAGDHPSKGVKVKRPPITSENLTITWKRCEIGGKLVLITNRKTYVLSIGTKFGDLE